MNKEECVKAIETLTNEYHAEKARLYEQYMKDKQGILDRWASDNARFKVGDIILANDSYMLVTAIKGYEYYEKTCAVYHGKALTKKLQPRKDCWKKNIYDDGRKIQLIKSVDTNK